MHILERMRSRLRRLLPFLLALGLLTGAAVMTTATNAYASSDATPVLAGSGWFGGNGVNICSDSGDNGTDGSDPTCGGQEHVGGPAGAYWQCVELAQRFYQAMGWHTGVFPDVTYADDIYTTSAAVMGMSTQANGSITSIVPGDMIVHGPNDKYSPGAGHVAIVDHISPDGHTIYVYQQNAPYSASYSFSNETLSGGSGTDILGVVHSPSNHNTGDGVDMGQGTSTPDIQLMIRSDNAEFARTTITSDGGWNQETASSTASAVAVGGTTQMMLTGNGIVYARTTIGNSGWVQETNPGVGSAIAVSNTGVQMVLVTDGEVWAQNTIGSTNWTGEAGAGTAIGIAVGGNEQLMIRSDGALFERGTITSNGGWNQETNPGVAQQVAVSSQGVQMVLVTDGEVWAQNTIGSTNWTQEAGPDTATAVAVGGNTQMMIRSDGTVFERGTITSNGGWNQETNPGIGQAIAVSNSGVQMVLVTDGEVWAQNTVGSSNWTGEAGTGTAIAIAAAG